MPYALELGFCAVWSQPLSRSHKGSKRLWNWSAPMRRPRRRWSDIVRTAGKPRCRPFA